MSEKLGRADKRWTWEEEEWLIYYHRVGWTLPRISETLERSLSGVDDKLSCLRRSGRIDFKPSVPYLETTAVHKLFGVHRNTFQQWIKGGKIRPVRYGMARTQMGFTEAEIMKFIREYCLWLSPHTMEPGKFRARLEQEREREGQRWMERNEAAKEKGVCVSTLFYAIQAGHLRMWKQGRIVFVLRSDLARWRPDVEKGRKIKARKQSLKKAA
jgi:hypothetical protein